MSTCISRAGEYSNHLTSEGEFICDRCGVLDEDGIFAERDALRAEVERLGAALNISSEAHRAAVDRGWLARQRVEDAECLLAAERAKVARVEALCEQADLRFDEPRLWTDEIRAALAEADQ